MQQWQFLYSCTIQHLLRCGHLFGNLGRHVVILIDVNTTIMRCWLLWSRQATPGIAFISWCHVVEWMAVADSYFAPINRRFKLNPEPLHPIFPPNLLHIAQITNWHSPIEHGRIPKCQGPPKLSTAIAHRILHTRIRECIVGHVAAILRCGCSRGLAEVSLWNSRHAHLQF